MKLDRTTAVTTAQKVADYLVSLGQKHGDPLTNLKLQKLLYYAQGWFIAVKSRPLFRDAIQAWPRGPVVYSVWKTYSRFRWNQINTPVHEPIFQTDIRVHLNEVFRAYGGFSAYNLEIMTHNEAPWQQARLGVESSESSNNEISLEDMRAHFSSLVNARAK